MSIKEDAIILGVTAIGLYLIGSVLMKKAKEIAPNLDPTDPNNVVNKAAESAYKSLTGSTGTLGGDIYDMTHGVETTIKTESPVGIAGTSIFEAMTGGVYDN